MTQRTVAVHLCDSLDDFDDNPPRGSMPDMIPIDISIGFEPNSARITHKLC